jgi:hypothetical protein
MVTDSTRCRRQEHGHCWRAVVSFGIGALMALTKSRKHFIGLTWDDAGKKGGVAFQASKKRLQGRACWLRGCNG